MPKAVLTAAMFIGSIALWREQLAEAMASDDPLPLLAHLDIGMQQTENALLKLYPPDEPPA